MATKAEEKALAESGDPEVRTGDLSADLPGSVPADFRSLAEDLPEKDPVQKAYKQALSVDDSKAEAKAYAKAAEESPNALETPSGAALDKVKGISHDTKRGEEYAREKAARRWGTVPADES